MSETYRPNEIAKRLGVGLSKVHGWIHAGELQAINIATRPDMQPRFVVTAEALAEFEQSRTTTKPTPSLPRRRRNVEVKSYV